MIWTIFQESLHLKHGINFRQCSKPLYLKPFWRHLCSIHWDTYNSGIGRHRKTTSRLNIQWIPDIWIHSKSAWNVVLKLILKCLTAVILPHWSAQKESCWDVRSFKGLNTIYENISKYHYRIISFLIIFKKLFFIFRSR